MAGETIHLLDNKEDYQKFLEIIRKYSPEDIARSISYGISKKDAVEVSNQLNLYNTGLKNFD